MKAKETYSLYVLTAGAADAFASLAEPNSNFGTLAFPALAGSHSGLAVREARVYSVLRLLFEGTNISSSESINTLSHVRFDEDMVQYAVVCGRRCDCS